MQAENELYRLLDVAVAQLLRGGLSGGGPSSAPLETRGEGGVASPRSQWRRHQTLLHKDRPMAHPPLQTCATVSFTSSRRVIGVVMRSLDTNRTPKNQTMTRRLRAGLHRYYSSLRLQAFFLGLLFSEFVSGKLFRLREKAKLQTIKCVLHGTK